jgi:hypothetical protein
MIFAVAQAHRFLIGVDRRDRAIVTNFFGGQRAGDGALRAGASG